MKPAPFEPSQDEKPAVSFFHPTNAPETQPDRLTLRAMVNAWLARPPHQFDNLLLTLRNRSN